MKTNEDVNTQPEGRTDADATTDLKTGAAAFGAPVSEEMKSGEDDKHNPVE